MSTAQYIDFAILLLAGLTFAPLSIWIGHLFRPQHPDPSKLSIYECGEVPIGDAHVQFHVRYYVFALVFLVFDVETVFLYPWAVVYRQIGWFAFGEVAVFVGMLVVGLVYAIKKRVLRWI